jgi:hypothetical protein
MNDIIPFVEKFPHTRLQILSVTNTEVKESEVPDGLTNQHDRLRFIENYYIMSINDGVLKATIHKGIAGIIEPTYLYDIWYQIRPDTTIELLMALRVNL